MTNTVEVQKTKKRNPKLIYEFYRAMYIFYKKHYTKKYNVFVNIAGGLRVNDPAIDMAVLAAVLSSNMDIPLDEDISCPNSQLRTP